LHGEFNVENADHGPILAISIEWFVRFGDISRENDNKPLDFGAQPFCW